MIHPGPRVECPECGRVVGSWIPADGDGTAWRVRHHHYPPDNLERLQGRRYSRRGRCTGTGALVDEIHESSGLPWRRPK